MTQHYCAACHHPLLDNDFRHICQSVLEARVATLERALKHSLSETKQWTCQANQYAAALNESRGHVIQMRNAIRASGNDVWADVLKLLQDAKKGPADKG
jgi:hypothetical protein